MKTAFLAANFLLVSAFVSAAGAATVAMSPPPSKTQPQAQPKVIAAPDAAKSPAAQAPAVQAKTDCPCNCPRDRKVGRDAGVRPPHMRRHARSGHYHYAAALPFHWHGHWRVAPNDAFIPGSRFAPGYEVEGLNIEDRGWTGGVGFAPDGGGGGGFVDGYGQVHFANGGENGPTYNSYGQSFQYNPSQAGPFQPRQMGGFAPPSTGSR